MKNDYTHISIVLDRSGSMDVVRDDTIGGFNSFINSQKAAPGRCSLTLVQFDDYPETLHSHTDIRNVSHLNNETYVPRGSTALLDAVGKTVETTGEYLRGLSESERPAKVIFVILTDGEENASRHFSRQRIFDMIAHQRDNYRWEFLFIGANQDAFAQAGGIGIGVGQTIQYSANAAGTQNLYASMASNVVRCRSAAAAGDLKVSANWTDADRDLQAQAAKDDDIIP